MMQRFASAIAFVVLVLSLVKVSAQSTNAPAKPLLWNRYEQVNFQSGSLQALLVKPTMPAPGTPWIWRTEFFGHMPQADLALLAKGWHVAYVKVSNMYGSPASVELMEQFYKTVTRDCGLNKRTVLEGFSRGGLYAVNFAATYPDQVAALYLDAPVLDIRSWPGAKGTGKGDPNCWKQAMQIYGLTEQSASSFSGNPLDHLEPIAKAGIPIIVVCGDADKTVPMAENTTLLESRYKSMGGVIQVIVKPGCDHHPHSLTDPKPIVDFLLEQTKKSAGNASTVHAQTINNIASPTPSARKADAVQAALGPIPTATALTPRPTTQP